MTELKGYIRDLRFSIDGKAFLTVEIDGNAKALYENFKEKLLSIRFKIFRNRRSNNANAYCWVLCTQIANVLRLDKDAVYEKMLKQYGQSQLISVRADITILGYIKYFEEAGSSVLNGKEFTHFRIFKGSSEYDTEEMCILLDGIVQEAEALSIPVLSDRELSLLKEAWK